MYKSNSVSWKKGKFIPPVNTKRNRDIILLPILQNTKYTIFSVTAIVTKFPVIIFDIFLSPEISNQILDDSVSTRGNGIHCDSFFFSVSYCSILFLRHRRRRFYPVGKIAEKTERGQ